MKYILYIVLGFWAASAGATGSYHHNTINHYNTEITEISQFYEETVGSELAGAVSLAIAHSSLQFSASTKKLQLGLGAGTYDGEESGVIGLGKLFDFGLLSGSVGRTHSHNSGAVSLTITF